MKKNYFKSLMQAAVLVCTPLVIASCDDVFGDTDNPIPAYMSIKQSEINLVLHADKKDQATATRTAIAATGAEVVYESSNEKVATVDAKTGVITGVGEGTCEIIAKVTGKDSNGRDTYQPQQASFSVSVKDYRARIALKEGVEIPVFNSALASTAEPIELKDIIDVWPALDTKGLTVTYTVTEADPTKPVIASTASNQIKLNNQPGTAKVKASIAKGDVPDGFEQASFPKGQETAEFTIEVKQGVAYVSGYDAKGDPITKYMFKDYNGESYTNLSDVLKGSSDVALAAGWYYLDKSIDAYNGDFAENIRIKGDVNIILGDASYLNMNSSKSIMDESANKAYKLSFFPETKAASGWVYSNKIQDFKEVNILGVGIWSNIQKAGDVSIIKGSLHGTMSGTGNVNITDGSASDIEGFATVTLAKGTANVGILKTIGSAIISEGTSTGNLVDVTTLTVDKAASIGSIYASNAKKPITSATITETNVGRVQYVTTLTLNKVKAIGTLNNITTLNINKGTEVGAANTTTNFLQSIGTVNMADGSKVWSANAKVNALNINGGDMVVYYQITGFDTNGAAAGKITMAGGTLKVGESLTANNVKAVLADVEVTKGDFTAESNYHAVEGALVGTFYGSTDKKNWTKIENEDRPKYITTIAPKK